MKTIKNLLFVAFAAISITACQKELADPNANNGSQNRGPVVTFTGSLDEVETKTTIWYDNKRIEAGKCPTMFRTADHITVNGIESGDMNKLDEHGTKVSFNVEGVTGPYYAVTAAQNKGYENGVYTVQVNGTGKAQEYRLVNGDKSISFDSNADILAAYSEDKTLHFKHMTTFYAISVDTENSSVKDNIRAIYIRQAGDTPNIAGQWSLSFEGKDHTPTLTPKSLSTVISYDCSEKDKEGNAQGVAQGKVMMVGVPAYDYADGLIITLKDVNDKFASYKIPASQTQLADKGGFIIPFKPKFNPGSGVIKTAADWEDFAAAINSGSDSKLYRWVGNGTVKLGANIEAENLSSITKPFPYIFDGGGFSIKRTSATKALFYELTGEIKNLTLEGELNLTDDGAAFVKNLHAGARITECTNKMDINIKVTSGPFYIGGIASIMVKQDSGDKSDTQIVGCKNEGQITGTGDFSENSGFVGIGGLVGDIRAAGGSVPYDVVFKDCTNEGTINFAPIPPADHTTAGMELCAMGGIAGYIRSGKTLTFDNCDNSGNITLSAEHMTNDKGMKAYAICMGGIIGFGTANSSTGVVTTDGFDISLEGCDNSGVLYNCGDNYSTSTQGTNKVYTGGLAGALMGFPENHALIKTCTNTGNIFTYDLATGDQAIVSQRPAYNAVAGGLIGYGGYLDMDGCTVNCQIGSGKRGMVAWGGMVGFLVKPFTLKDSTIHLSGYFMRISNYKFNRAVVGVVPVGVGAAIGDINGSTITGTLTISGSVRSSGSLISTGTSKTDLSSSYNASVLNDLSKVKASLVNGGKEDKGPDAHGVNYSNATITYSAN